MLGGMCLVALLQLVRLFLLVLSVLVFPAYRFMCSHVCSVFYWLSGDGLLMYSGVVSLRLHFSVEHRSEIKLNNY